MPWPQNITLNEGSFTLSSSFKVTISGIVNPRIFVGTTNFLRRLDGRTGMFFSQGYIKDINEDPSAQLQINSLKKGVVGINQDESYKIEITSNKITIDATTDIGVLHALETLLQLLQNNGDSFYFPNVIISDFPAFTWRGLMIDVARHFQPVDVIKRNIDAMAAVKLNVFHWHLVDDQGWRIELKNKKKLTELASDGNYYTQEEIKNIVEYADQRGILIVPEIDVPGHATAILTAYPEIGSKYLKEPNEQKQSQYKIERNSGIFRPTLDPSNPETYKFLSEVFDEVCPLFPAKYFHIGGDENEGKDWDANPVIQKFKQKNNLKTNHELQSYFTLKLVPMLKKHNKEIMGWEEIMNDKMPKGTIIHSWKGSNEGSPAGESLVNAAKEGFKTILSNGFYIDLMQSVNDHYLSPIIPKETVLSKEEKDRILGGEVTMWSELVTSKNIDSRIWPRTAAIAEVFWSNEKDINLKSMKKRLQFVSNRLEELGINHIKNKKMILRNISNYQDVSSLVDLSNICEPLKIYTRNKGGTEYQTYSPFTLFADACTSDASDAIDFNEVVDNYLQDKSPKNLNRVTEYFKKWIFMHSDLIKLSENAPLIKPILPLSQSLSELSTELLAVLELNKSADKSLFNKLLINCNSRNHADVELVIGDSFKKIIDNIN
ncbi:family 20 glycosylhydrolase [Flavobacterium jejuense]|uniref:Family 20 glycosylhydrolase n=2 Tax=Flavobacterium jejuense TaxID=1544455 RepID=A0ABX0IM78_9FLAO|nr:family 20 glycosylhydrolase [Flavobacterium jejuense]